MKKKTVPKSITVFCVLVLDHSWSVTKPTTVPVTPRNGEQERRGGEIQVLSPFCDTRSRGRKDNREIEVGEGTRSLFPFRTECMRVGAGPYDVEVLVCRSAIRRGSGSGFQVP